MIDPEEYKKKFYKKGGYHWETSGRHAYAVLCKYADKDKPKQRKKTTERKQKAPRPTETAGNQTKLF